MVCLKRFEVASIKKSCYDVGIIVTYLPILFNKWDVNEFLWIYLNLSDFNTFHTVWVLTSSQRMLIDLFLDSRACV